MTIIDRTACTAPRHGDEWAYSKNGCRCPDGREAWRVYSLQRRQGINRARLVDISPTATRIRILAALGYDWRTIARTAGWRTPKQVTDLAYTRQPRVSRRTQSHIANLFADLTSRPQPHGYPALRAINNAERAGWGLVDPEIVRRALAGHRVDLTPLEKAAVLHIGLARGLAPTAIAAAAQTNNRSVNALAA